MKTRSFNNRRPKKYFSQSRYKNAGSSSLGRRRPMSRFKKKIDPARFINKAIAVEDNENFTPKHNFQDFKIDQRLIAVVKNKGYKIPTPIQDQIIPYIIDGFDVVGIADTGTGKTAAFILPLINKILRNSKKQILIVVPTRELAIQIDHEFKFFARGMRTFSVCCVGGVSIGRQISELRHNYNLIIGTPGRLKDLMGRRIIDLSKFDTVVLDEADRMFDMGFINDTRFIMNGMPRERQTLFFSATISNKIEEIKIKPEDLRLDTFRSSGPGGQYVNKRESAVRITHLPTGTTVSSQSERLQGLNKDKAMKVLYAKLYQLKEAKRKKELKEIKGKTVSASWGNQIRSYVLHPYKLVKDLRTGVETSDVEEVLDGDLDKFIEKEIRN